jgi:hypothetical protein
MPLGAVASARNAKELHHIWPRDLLKRNGISPKRVNALCNICYLVAHDNRSFGSKKPRHYLDEFRQRKHFSRAMRSHLIPYDASSPLWEERVKLGFRGFIDLRRRLIQNALNKAAGVKLFEP